jgi:hypothetical protein
MVFLDGARGIHLEYHQSSGPFSISGNLFISVSYMVLFYQRGRLSSGLHPPFLGCELVLLEIIRLIDFATQLTAVLHAGSLTSCHNFLSPCLCFNNRSKQGRTLFTSESVTLVDNLNAEATGSTKSRAALSASVLTLISLLGFITSEARL